MSEANMAGATGANRQPPVLPSLQPRYDGAFAQWAKDFMDRGRYETDTVPDVDRRIRQVVRLRDLLPCAQQWERERDDRLHDKNKRYLRGQTRSKKDGPHVPRGEHLIEHTILCPDMAAERTTSLGLPLVDGINAVPLATDRSGGRSGNVEADMLLLVGEGSDWQLQLVEVKDESNNAWFAVVESLRQLMLFEHSKTAQQIMVERRAAPADLKLTGIVLARATFYTAKGKKQNSVAPALQLIRHAEEQLSLRCVLAVWNSETREITQLDP
jgi:hypothetical protein